MHLEGFDKFKAEYDPDNRNALAYLETAFLNIPTRLKPVKATIIKTASNIMFYNCEIATKSVIVSTESFARNCADYLERRYPTLNLKLMHTGVSMIVRNVRK